MMLIAVDTSTAQVGLALYDGEQVHGEMMWTTRQHHTTQLASALSGLLSRCDVMMDMVQALAVAIGPGSFTSLRVGLSLVKGIALARNLPLVGIPTLDIIAAAQPAAKHPLIAVLQAGRKRIAYSVYQSRGKGGRLRAKFEAGRWMS
jgi:tRNA threonylcarbamoyladenosine biosynthesis protein TsaB